MACKHASEEEGGICPLEGHSPRELRNDEYCCFHLPFESEDYEGTKKSEWETEKLHQFELSLKNLIGGISGGGKLDLSNTKIPTEITINNILSELDLSFAHIKGRFNIEIQKIQMVREKGCLFCEMKKGRVIASNELCYAIRDGFEVTQHHTLIIPKRHVSDFFELHQPEINAVHTLLDEMKRGIEELDETVTGFNIGINSGKDAGQTIFHCHIHLIPRREGDVENPLGGVRGVIPDKRIYKAKKPIKSPSKRAKKKVKKPSAPKTRSGKRNSETKTSKSFEKKISELTQLINGQYPRPWMTDLKRPENAKALVVGMNPATAYTKKHVKSHSQFMDVHFNRNGHDCRSFYATVRAEDDRPSSPSRINIETLTKKLVENEISEILETNIYCYSTPKFRDLNKKEHPGGKEKGLEIFEVILAGIRPKIIILHGAKVRKEFVKIFDRTIPTFPMVGTIPKKTTELFKSKVRFETHTSTVFVIPSLSAPGSDHWKSWADDYLVSVVKSVKRHLK